jgi:hypothetical protein
MEIGVSWHAIIQLSAILGISKLALWPERSQVGLPIPIKIGDYERFRVNACAIR